MHADTCYCYSCQQVVSTLVTSLQMTSCNKPVKLTTYNNSVAFLAVQYTNARLENWAVFDEISGDATAVKSKGRGEKSDLGAGSGAAKGAKTNAAMYMSNEYRYLKPILFNYYAGHNTDVHCVDMQPR